MDRTFFKAQWGQSGLLPSLGSEMILISSWVWRVLVHFTRIFTNFWEKKISPVARCLDMSKVENECGVILDSLKKPKNATRNTALKMGCTMYHNNGLS